MPQPPPGFELELPELDLSPTLLRGCCCFLSRMEVTSTLTVMGQRVTPGFVCEAVGCTVPSCFPICMEVSCT